MPEPPGVPEIYADVVQVATSNLGIFFGFRAFAPLYSEPDAPEAQDDIPLRLKALVRMDPKDAKAFAILLRASLKRYEGDHGTIPLPDGFSEAIDLGVDEW